MHAPWKFIIPNTIRDMLINSIKLLKNIQNYTKNLLNICSHILKNCQRIFVLPYAILVVVIIITHSTGTIWRHKMIVNQLEHWPKKSIPPLEVLKNSKKNLINKPQLFLAAAGLGLLKKEMDHLKL